MGTQLDSPPIYDVLTKISKDYLSPYWQEWLASFYQAILQKFINWTTITSSQNIQVSYGYFCNGIAQLSMALPSTSDVGDIFRITSITSFGWVITQAPGQQIQVRNTTTTLGVGGTLASSTIGDAAELVCVVPNLKWMLLSHEGTLAVV